MIFKNAVVYRAGCFQKMNLIVENGYFVESARDYSSKDLYGMYVMPGFIDSHAHLVGVGKKYLQINLENVKSQAEIFELVSKSSSPVVFGRGWTEEKLHAYPDKEMLDMIDKPVILVRRCGHVAIANEKAMQIAGMRKSDGIFREGEIEALKSKFPEEDCEKYLRAGENAFLSKGVTFVHSDDFHNITWEKLQEALSKAKIRIFEKVYLQDVKRLEDFKEFGKLTDRVIVGAVKAFADGSLGGKTAYLSKSYPDTPGYYGMKLLDRSTIRRLAEVCKTKNIQLCIHAIGDAAVHEVAEALKDYPENRIIHVQLIKKDDLEKLRNTYISIQPHFMFEDENIIRFNIPNDLDALRYPFRQLYEKGFKIGFSTDAPVSPEDPKYVIEAALKQDFTKGECIDLYTIANAQMVKLPVGKIEVGYLADFAVYERDPTKFEDDPVAVYVSGELVWER